MTHSLRVFTWNVLHRVHAENYSEPVLEKWPDERARMAAIADRVERSNADVVCLQEVSGDQLALLRSTVRGETHAFIYPRVPSYRRKGFALEDTREHLVIIVRNGTSRGIGGAAFASDPGKGYLAVELDGGVSIINTHVSYGEKRAAQMRVLATFTERAVIITGDFNADRATCAALLGGTYAGATLEPSALHTRPRQKASETSEDIDHVFARGLTVASARVEDGEGCSDHNPVLAVFRGEA